jgi:sec-independent protein translocase protein TatA
MPNLGFWEIIAIMAVVLLVFGAKRLPEIGASMGKGIREFKRSITETQDAVMRDDSATRSMLDSGKTPGGDQQPTSGEPRRLSQ